MGCGGIKLRRSDGLFACRGEFNHGVTRDVRDIAEIAYRGDPPIDQSELDEVAGLSVVRIAEHGNDLARVQ